MSGINQSIPARSASGIRAWPAYLALGFVIFALLTVIIAPLLTQQRVDARRAEIVQAESARTLLIRLQYNLVREITPGAEFLLHNEGSSAANFAGIIANEHAILGALAPMAEQLGPDFRSFFDQVEAQIGAWHDRVDDPDFAELRAAGALMERPRERALFENALRSTVVMDSAIVHETTDERTRITDAEQMDNDLTYVLAAVALLGALAAGALSRRVHGFARESQRRREEAEHAIAEMERAEKAREMLIRGITHDVKNPLGAAHGYAQLLAMGVRAPLLPEQAPLVEGVERSLNSALAIISDLLDLARADGGALKLQMEKADLNEITRNAVEAQRPAIEAAGHTLTFEPASEPIVVQTDAERAGQILGNLLTNAMKYTPAPGVIRVRTYTRKDGLDWGVVAVSDNGPGIPAESTETIFDEFTRLGDERKAKGHGLGLAIARRIARMLGGDLGLEKTDGPGATFVLRLPIVT